MFRLAKPPEMATVARKLPSVASQGRRTPRGGYLQPLFAGRAGFDCGIDGIEALINFEKPLKNA